ncbi:MAG: outer membrane beta-barrel protein [Flavobacteriales bacterium]|nr:outer membrane beta-barrel protein [Flavobacteriales bacterium]MBP7156068.1 outer membrane beta-barrel protein [Flavobacteriales bacterium]HQV75857.1 outer membrane beta-barrel protein [Flavobacteriales bacterium]
MLLLIAPYLALPGMAQRPSGVPAIGTVIGKVLDATTKKPAEYATVAVYTASNDSLINGTTVRPNGDFSLEKLPLGTLRLTISFIGYRPLSQTVTLTRESVEQDLGNLLLEPDAELLKEFEVTGEKSTTIMQVDRRVFNVDKDLSTQGGSAVDVMKNIPGLSVDIDGNVQMRGSNPQILIDGRPTSMVLDQIPAGDIERIELITNPSVAFDASSTGGILNVILKKNTKPGYNGQLQAGVGTNDRYQAGANLNLKQGRWGFNLSYNFNTGRNTTNGDTRRTDLLDGDILGYFDQDARSRSGRGMNGGRLGVDFQVSNRSTLTFNQSYRAFKRDGYDHQDFSSYGPGRELLNTGLQLNSSDTEFGGLTSQLLFLHKSPKEGKQYTVDFTYNNNDRESWSTQDISGSNVDDATVPLVPRSQRNTGGSQNSQYTVQSDFVNPISERSKLEYGIKGNVRLDHTYLEVFLTTPSAGTDVRDAQLSNDYDITEMINAAYINWSRKLTESWSLMAGLRFEQSWFEAKLRDKDEQYSYKYPDGFGNLDKALFPSLYIVRRWKDSEREFQINFSRKIGRPRHWQVVPFIQFNDARNVRIGNPTLAPEMSNLAEMNHLLPFLGGKATWLTSVYGRYTTGVISSYATPLPGDTTGQITLTTYVNGSYSAGGGWENILKLDPVKGMQVTLSNTLQYTNVALSSAQGGSRNEGFNWEAKAIVSYRFGKKSDWTAQLNGEYESPEIRAQGKSIAQYGLDASVAHDFTKKLTGVFSVNDVFYSRKWGNIIDTPFLYQENFSRREQRFFKFTLTWKFGEQRDSLFRRKGSAPRREPGGGDEMEP